MLSSEVKTIVIFESELVMTGGTCDPQNLEKRNDTYKNKINTKNIQRKFQRVNYYLPILPPPVLVALS